MRAESGAIPQVVPHMDFRDEGIANGNGIRLDAKRNEAALLVQRLGACIALRDRELHEHDARAVSCVIERCANELTANAAMPELGWDVHAEERCLVPGFFARLE